jgi:hypothetical protein
MKRYLPDRYAVAVYGVLLAIHLGFMVKQTVADSPHLHWDMFDPLVIEALPVLAAACFFFLDWQWCRWLVLIFAILTLPLIAFSPIAQHAIDRTPTFWALWSVWLVSTLLVIIPLKKGSSQAHPK